MTYSVLEKKLHDVPEQYFSQVSAFLDIILNLSKESAIKKETKGRPILGLAKGKWKYLEDINLHDDEIAEALGITTKTA